MQYNNTDSLCSDESYEVLICHLLTLSGTDARCR